MKDLLGRESCPPHPGEVLREDILPHYGLTRKDLAAHLGISTRHLGEVLRERRDITLDLALRLGAAFGQGAHFWLGLQMQHSLWQARNQEAPVRPIRRLVAEKVFKARKSDKQFSFGTSANSV